MIESSIKVVRRLVAYLVLLISYGSAFLVARFSSAIPRHYGNFTGPIVVIGTFHNPNWFLSHILPLSRCGVDEVLVVTDQALAAPDNVRFLCPPEWLARVIGRALAKLIWLIISAVRYKPQLFIGYHIFPGALTALIVGKLFGRPTCYQMTGGPNEILKGGIYNENHLMRWLAHPSSLLENLALAVIRQFELVVVRGSKAKAFLAERGIRNTVVVITGSVLVSLEQYKQERCYDLVFVGRLTEIKQPLQFVDIVAAAKQRIPSLRAVIVGEGNLFADLFAYAIELGVSDSIDFLGKKEDVNDILSQSKLFILTSRSEGLSIAMAEAMMAGVVPIVANVGDLGDLVTDGINGYLINTGTTSEYVERIVALSNDSELCNRHSKAAVGAATRYCSRDIVIGRWTQALRDMATRLRMTPLLPQELPRSTQGESDTNI